MNQIRKMRIKKKLTQQQLAEKLGVKRTTVTLWESGKNKPRVDTLIELAKVFKCGVNSLICPK